MILQMGNALLSYLAKYLENRWGGADEDLRTWMNWGFNKELGNVLKVIFGFHLQLCGTAFYHW